MFNSPIRAAVLAVGALLLLAGIGFAAGNRPSGTDDTLAASAAASSSTVASPEAEDADEAEASESHAVSITLGNAAPERHAIGIGQSVGDASPHCRPLDH